MNLRLIGASLALILLMASCAEWKDSSSTMGLVSARVENSITPSFSDDVKPILDARCISCHACYDAPCQLKLTAYEGVARGGSKDKVYDHKSLSHGNLSRLFFDAHSAAEWRSKGFHPVLSVPQGEQSEDQATVQTSTLVGMLDLKRANPLPANSVVDDSLPIDDSGSWQCPSNREEFLDFAADYPRRGMPYALPGLSIEEESQLKDWVAAGAVDDSDYSLSNNEATAVSRWEAFFNGDSIKQKLVARYIYEHLFLASLYFDAADPVRFFQLVRSTTPPGSPIDVVATRRPYDHPGVERVYYRLRLNKETVVAKTHMPYLLDQTKMEDWDNWFFQTDYSVTALPGYELETASNPFKTFAQLPAEARYRFMLSEANFTVKGFIKGPVCKGQSAVNVINEHFWVFFVDPKFQAGEAMTQYLATVQDELDLPAEKDDTLRLFSSWDEFADKEKAFLKERRKFIQQYLSDEGALDTNVIWDGDGQNANAGLTVYRHFDNASVHQGLNGQAPKTAWVIDYPLLERIHYLLVAGYDVYGNVSHQLLSRVYMDFLRMEGESMFLLLLSEQNRIATRRYWYREADDRIKKFMSLTDLQTSSTSAAAKSDLDSSDRTSNKPKLDVYQALEARIAPAMERKYRIKGRESLFDQRIVRAANKLQSVQSKSFAMLPEVSLLQIAVAEDFHYFTLIRNRGHLNNTSILFENLNLKPEETTLSLVPGFIGPRPNTLMRLHVDELESFSDALLTLRDETDYRRLAEAYIVTRTDPRFWDHYDQFMTGYRKFDPVDYGILDLNKLESR